MKRANFQATEWPVLVVQALCALVFAVLLAACGGGYDEPIALRAPSAAVAAPLPPLPSATVRFTGGVIDDSFRSRASVAVRALAGDVPLLGNAISDARDAFKLVLPVLQTVSVAIDPPGGEAMRVATGRSSRSVDLCLIDEAASKGVDEINCSILACFSIHGKEQRHGDQGHSEGRSCGEARRTTSGVEYRACGRVARAHCRAPACVSGPSQPRT